MEKATVISGMLPEKFVQHLCLERGLSINTTVTYRHHVNGYLGFLSERGGSPVSAMRSDISAYLGSLRVRGLQSATIHCAAAALEAFYDFLCKQGTVEVNPVSELALPKLTTRIVEALSPAEVERLLDAPSSRSFCGLRDRAVLEVMYCGLRIGEAMALDVADVHLGEAYAKVHGKGNKERLVPISGKAVEALRRYLESRQQRPTLTQDALFISRCGTRMTKNGFWRSFKHHVVRAGITRRVYPHLIRHSFALHLLAGRADLRSLQLLLGHSNLTTTQRYLHLDVAALRETCRRAHPRF